METRHLKSQGPISSKNDKISANYQICSMLKSLLADFCSVCVSYSEADYILDVRTVEKRVYAEGIGFAARILPTLAKGMFTYLETGEALYPCFKLQAKTKHPRFLKGIFKIVYGPNTDVEKAYAIDCIYQMSVLYKKLLGTYSEKLISEKYADFVDVDVQVGAIFDALSDSDFEVLELARQLFNEDWADFDVQGLQSIPRPGPGATRSHTPKHMRYVPHKFFSVHQECFPYEEWFYSHPWAVVDDARHYLNLKKDSVKGYPTARMLYVPKYYGTPRGICIEEHESQWLQQGCATAMRSHIGKSSILRGHIEFNDQTINQMLALISSEDQEDATIDMEGGSDRNPRDLVSWVTQDNVDFHNALMCLSTRTIEPPKGITSGLLSLSKYAPMGSGLCFPVMGLMHYYLILAIVKRYHDSDIRERLYVYGDDIVLPTRDTELVFSELPKYGMKLNRNKSFARSKFRESCGVHAYNGMNITPVFVRRILIPGKIDTMVSTFATEELLHNKGLFHVAKCLRDLYTEVHGHVPFITTTSPLVGWKRPPGFAASPNEIFSVKKHRARRKRSGPKDPDYQCLQYRVPCVEEKSRSDDENIPENQGYLRHMVQRTENSSIYRGAPEDQVIRWRWKMLAECMPDQSESQAEKRRFSCSARAFKAVGNPRNYLLWRSNLRTRINRHTS